MTQIHNLLQPLLISNKIYLVNFSSHKETAWCFKIVRPLWINVECTHLIPLTHIWEHVQKKYYNPLDWIPTFAWDKLLIALWWSEIKNWCITIKEVNSFDFMFALNTEPCLKIPRAHVWIYFPFESPCSDKHTNIWCSMSLSPRLNFI